MGRLKERSLKLLKKEDILKPENLEKVFKEYDDVNKDIDNRRVVQQTSLADSATLADVISSLNTFFTNLNDSDLSEE